MSAEFPIIALTGSSGAGSSTITRAFEHIFWRDRVNAAYIQGSGFHRYSRAEMEQQIIRACAEDRILSHYGPEGNCLDKLETLFFQYSAIGTGMRRYYLHTDEQARKWDQEVGTLTPWKKIEGKTDLLLYRGLHGAAIDGDIDISQYPDLLIGIVPIVNLEWMRKIGRDITLRGYSMDEVRQSILCRMHDYVRHITPQFTRTHINFQMVSTVDTSDPFALDNIMPTEDESFIVISFQRGMQPDFIELLSLLPNSFMSRRDTLVVPGSALLHAIEIILMPLVHDLVVKGRELRKVRKLPKQRKAGLHGVLGQSDS
ncbi:MAG: phosphoribulokinase [Gammaproteobacteria bacterium]|nr:phosphoribulokinase [Gammaproteobacteria bacterium]